MQVPWASERADMRLEVFEAFCAMVGLTQLLLFMMILGLARNLQSLGSVRSRENRWPLEKLQPGDDLPEPLLEACPTASSEMNTGFYLCAVNVSDIHSLVFMLETVCRVWHKEFILMCAENVSVEPRLTGVTKGVGMVVGLAGHLGISQNVVLYVQKGRIVDAACDLSTPAMFRGRFEFLAR
jgi:hypothetical protein